MEGVARRADLLRLLRARHETALACQLPDSEAVQLAVALRMRAPDDVVRFLFPAHIAKAALLNRSSLAITTDEWRGLFAQNCRLRDTGLAAIVQSADFAKHRQGLETALRCTIAENAQQRVWQTAWGQALCVMATHLDAPDEILESTVGAIVKADARRLEEVHAAIDDDGAAEMFVSKLVIALANNICH